MPTKRLLRSEEGSALVEFAMLAPIFFLMVVALAEFVLYQYKSYALNHVVYQATRNLQTGEIQNVAGGNVAKAFQDEVCAQAGPMIDCASMVFDVRNFGSIAEVQYPPPIFDDQGRPVNFVFLPGGTGRYTVVRATIHHEFVTPFMAELFGMGPDLPALLSSYSIVRNEPW